MTVNVSILVERAKAFSKKYGVPITKNQFEGTLDDRCRNFHTWFGYLHMRREEGRTGLTT